MVSGPQVELDDPKLGLVGKADAIRCHQALSTADPSFMRRLGMGWAYNEIVRGFCAGRGFSKMQLRDSSQAEV